MLFAIMVGLGAWSTVSIIFSLTTLLSLIAYSLGLSWIIKESKNKLLGYRMMIIACFSTFPLSLIFGLLPAKYFAQHHGVLELSVESDASANSRYPKKYFVRAFFRHMFTVAMVFGLLISLMMIAIGKYDSLLTIFIPFAMALFTSYYYRQPKIVLTEKELITTPNQMGPTLTIPLDQIVGIKEEKKSLDIQLKNKSFVKIPKFELSSNTRASCIKDLNALIKT